MNKFDELMMLNEQLDAVLTDMRKANKHFEDELKAKRNALQEQVFEDMAVLREYIRNIGMKAVVLNTGINPTKSNNRFAALDINTASESIGFRTTDGYNTSRDQFYYWFEKDIPVVEASDPVRDFMFTVMEHWDEAYANMQDDLFEQMQDFMAKKSSEVIEQQRILVNELDRFNERSD